MDTKSRIIEVFLRYPNVSQDIAEKLYNLYTQEKLIKVDGVTGQWSVVHGALLDNETVQKAVELVGVES